jgi:hypothetical protein
VKETLPLEAFHGRHSRGVDLNHIKFLYIKIVMLEEEQVQRDNFCWFHKMKEIRQKYDQSDIIKYIYIYIYIHPVTICSLLYALKGNH